jgi:fructose-bisphosphate aldolase class I
MSTEELTVTIKALAAEGKGLLAMDESTPSCNKRFEKVGVPQTVEARRSYRELILSAPGLNEMENNIEREAGRR